MVNKKKLVKTISSLLVAAFISGFPLPASWAVSEAEVVARVNGEAITRQELEQSLERIKLQQEERLRKDLDAAENKDLLATLKYKVLESLVEKSLLLQQARKIGAKVDPAVIEQEVATIIKNHFRNDRKAFEAGLAESRISEQVFRAMIQDRLLIDQLITHITKDLKATDKEIADFYAGHPEAFQQQETIEARHILIAIQKRTDTEAQTRAQEVIDKLKSGSVFEALAKQYSDDPGNKEAGGNLGAFEKGMMVPAFEEAAWKLQPGAVSPAPVKTEFGYHIIQRGKTNPARTIPLAEAKGKIGEHLTSQKQEAGFEKWFAQIRSQAKIEMQDDSSPQSTLPKPEQKQ